MRTNSKKSAEVNKKELKAARRDLVVQVEIGKSTFRFEKDIFNLSEDNIAELNEQITTIAPDIAYVGQALGTAEKFLAETELAYELWRAQKFAFYDRAVTEKGKAAFSTEGQKERALIQDETKAYEEHQKKIAVANYLCRLLKSYMSAMDAKYRLSQTLCSNLRPEREAYGHEGRN